MASYARDKRVQRWCTAQGVAWQQFPQSGVRRHSRAEETRIGAAGLRDTWSKHWNAFIAAPQYPRISAAVLQHGLIRTLPSDGLQTAQQLAALGLLADPEDRPRRQHGGETLARQALQSFLTSRGEGYAEGISSPLTAWDSCSRLSTYLSWGHISLRVVVQAVQARQVAARQDPSPGRWRKSLQAVRSRLQWRSHFMQKLECEPEMEQQNQCRAYDALRTQPLDWDELRFRAWAQGKTGFPMVDACMRCLLSSGWVNFRMRAMLASFASYNLWLDWRRYGAHLAQCFLDYEPGIHYPQLQMQSGTTGINSFRVYNVTKQGYDQDPEGRFIRRHVPELKQVPAQYVHEPWRMPRAVQEASHCIIGQDYPEPIVDEQESAREAKSRLQAIRKRSETEREAQQVYQKHGSRSGRGGLKRPLGVDDDDFDDDEDAAPVKRPQPDSCDAPPNAHAPAPSPASVGVLRPLRVGPAELSAASTGRAACRSCGQTIAHGHPRVGVEVRLGGRPTTAWQHPGCFLAASAFATCAAARGACRASGAPFRKGDVALALGCGRFAAPVHRFALPSALRLLGPVLECAGVGIGRVRGAELVPPDAVSALDSGHMGPAPEPGPVVPLETPRGLGAASPGAVCAPDPASPAATPTTPPTTPVSWGSREGRGTLPESPGTSSGAHSSRPPCTLQGDRKVPDVVKQPRRKVIEICDSDDGADEG